MTANGGGLAWCAALLVAALGATRPAAAQRAELVDRDELRVCADPNNLPFSNRAGEGFENKIAALIGAEIDLPVSTVWYPQTGSFVRNTLGAHACDLVLGTAGSDGMMDSTNPYYHTGYMIVTRAADGFTATSIGDPALAGKRIGLVAATPPTDLALRHGLMPHVRSYALGVDTRYTNPARSMLQDLADGAIDVALVWGPVAGYAIRHESLPLHADFITPEPDAPRLDYRISMGVRANEPEWRRTINRAIAHQEGKIAAVLAEYGVPLLDEQARPIPASLEPQQPPEHPPVPNTVPGGTVVHAADIEALRKRGGVTLVDVFPAPRRPASMQPGMPWLPPARHDLPGSVWWPGVGREELPPALDAKFHERLDQLASARPGAMVVFYCMNNCWLSWYAAKRAASYGLKVGWFPEGADGWAQAGLPTQDTEPEFLE